MEERQKVLYEFNATEVRYPGDRCIHELFEEQAAKTPDAVAVVFEGREMSYSRLNRRANRLAHHLRGLGVKPDARVAICAERGFEMVIGLLAILKAGGAYVPLDPEYPAGRLRFMVEDSAPVALLTQSHLKAQFADLDRQVPVIDMEARAAAWSNQPESNPGRAGVGLNPEHLAYVIYTSGSTGRPKGVMNEHRAVCNRLFWGQSTFAFGPHDAVLQKTTFSFDVSVWEFFSPLIAGSRLVMARPGGQREPAYLCKTVQQNRITTLHFVPSMLQAFLDHDESGKCLSVVRTICSGEALPSALARRFMERLPWATLHNLYGPTEAAVEVTAVTCTPEIAERASIPIGRPIANTRMYILDEQDQPVPVGIAGQLHIGGVQVARGYLNRPELTAERFVSDPFASDPGERMYKTGDLAKWLPDGNIDFLGRIDHQVKIRGFRIELGEIEASLEQHAGVAQCVVSVLDDAPAGQRLVAYTVPKDPSRAPDMAELRDMLKQNLPDYMVPSAFVTVGRLPLTPNGKIDRNALASLKPSALHEPARQEEAVAPRTPLEAHLTQIWQRILSLPSVGIRDNFFDLGGHSLMAVQLVEEINRSLHLHFPFPEFAQNPTVEATAEIIQRQENINGEPKLLSLKPHRSSADLFFISPGLALCRMAQFLDAGPNLFATWVPLSPSVLEAATLNRTAALPSLEEMAAPHVALIQSQKPSGPCFLAGHSFNGLLAFEIAHQLHRAGRQVEMLLLLDTSLLSLRWWKTLQGFSWTEGLNLAKDKASRLFSTRKLTRRTSNFPVSDPDSAGISNPAGEQANTYGSVPWKTEQRIYRNARAKYRLRPVDCRAVLFRAEDSAASPAQTLKSAAGLGRLIARDLRIVDLPGNHQSIIQESNAPALARRFMECLPEVSDSQLEDLCSRR